MKKTLTINLNNTVYHIDSDAYELLQQYLNEVENRLSPDEKKEVMTDIEGRISELFTEKLQKGKNVINILDVEAVISILGKPNQFSEDDAESGAAPKTEKKFKRKFYRDPDNAVLGGVAAGLAAYIGWDVVWVRVLLVAIILFGWGTIIPIYIIVWLIVPPAKTISQKLEMQGEDVTAERIKSEINNLKNYVESDNFKESATGIGYKLGEVFRVFFKIVFGLIGAVMGFVGFILLGVLLLLLAFLIFEPSILTGFTPELGIFTSGKAALMIISLLLVVGIPFFLLIFWAINIITGKNRRSGPLGWVLLILWFAGIFLFAGLGAKTAFALSKGDFEHFEFNWSDDYDGDVVDEVRVVEPFHGIEVSGNIAVDIVQDSIQSVQVRSHPALLRNLYTEVDNGILKIRTRKIHFNRNVQVNIAAANFNVISIEGASNVKSFGKISAENMRIELSGVSKADLNVAVSRDLRIDMLGASKAELEGHAYKIKGDFSGATKLDAGDLLVRNARISGVGASHINLNVTDSLDVDVSGASHFKSNRSPLYLKQSKSGGASIRIN